MGTDRYILDEHRNPVPCEGTLVWGRWLEEASRDKSRFVKQEDVDGGFWVSTVFLGLNLNFGGGRPLLFETMVFHKDSGMMDLAMDRYSTWEEAENGHAAMVERVKRGEVSKREEESE